jgi:hypothetical protein
VNFELGPGRASSMASHGFRRNLTDIRIRHLRRDYGNRGKGMRFLRFLPCSKI